MPVQNTCVALAGNVASAGSGRSVRAEARIRFMATLNLTKGSHSCLHWDRLSNAPPSRQQDVVGLVAFLAGEEFLVRAVLQPETGEMWITERVDILDAAMHEH